MAYFSNGSKRIICPRCGKQDGLHRDGCQNPVVMQDRITIEPFVNKNGFIVFNPQDARHVQIVNKMLPRKYQHEDHLREDARPI